MPSLATVIRFLAFVAALGSGLIAGVFFAFSSFVMGALARLQPPQGIAAMQSINVVVVNPIFMTTFLGTGVVCVVLAVLALRGWSEPSAAFILAGCLVYVLGSVAVTMVCNVPLNDALAKVDPASADGATLWASYLTRWTVWNHVRTIASLAASAALIVALVKAAAGR